MVDLSEYSIAFIVLGAVLAVGIVIVYTVWKIRDDRRWVKLSKSVPASSEAACELELTEVRAKSQCQDSADKNCDHEEKKVVDRKMGNSQDRTSADTPAYNPSSEHDDQNGILNNPSTDPDQGSMHETRQSAEIHSPGFMEAAPIQLSILSAHSNPHSIGQCAAGSSTATPVIKISANQHKPTYLEAMIIIKISTNGKADALPKDILISVPPTETDNYTLTLSHAEIKDNEKLAFQQQHVADVTDCKSNNEACIQG